MPPLRLSYRESVPHLPESKKQLQIPIPLQHASSSAGFHLHSFLCFSHAFSALWCILPSDSAKPPRSDMALPTPRFQKVSQINHCSVPVLSAHILLENHHTPYVFANIESPHKAPSFSASSNPIQTDRSDPASILSLHTLYAIPQKKSFHFPKPHLFRCNAKAGS